MIVFRLVGVADAHAIEDAVGEEEGVHTAISMTLADARRIALEGVDKINNEVVACYLDVEGACHGNQTFTRQHCAVKQCRWQTTSVET